MFAKAVAGPEDAEPMPFATRIGTAQFGGAGLHDEETVGGLALPVDRLARGDLEFLEAQQDLLDVFGRNLRQWTQAQRALQAIHVAEVVSVRLQFHIARQRRRQAQLPHVVRIWNLQQAHGARRDDFDFLAGAVQRPFDRLVVCLVAQ